MNQNTLNKKLYDANSAFLIANKINELYRELGEIGRAHV